MEERQQKPGAVAMKRQILNHFSSLKNGSDKCYSINNLGDRSKNKNR
jgi:hypothetical protein